VELMEGGCVRRHYLLARFPLKHISPVVINDNFWRCWTEVIKSPHASDACGF